jgi:tetraacyldisaccharide 4'-kinase
MIFKQRNSKVKFILNKFLYWLWYKDRYWHLVLWPLHVVSFTLISLRFFAYKVGVLKIKKVETKVIIIGNLTVGGTGKTPIVIELASKLIDAGMRVGIVSRGYKGVRLTDPIVLDGNTPVEVSGDEPYMLREILDIPVAVGRSRVDASNLLLEQYDIDVILSDDGLQHLPLSRDHEIIVSSANLGLTNKLLIPSGPYRSVVSDAYNKANIHFQKGGKTKGNRIGFSLKLNNLLRLLGGDAVSFDILSGGFHAVTAIGDPSSFYLSLDTFSELFFRHTFEDHHYFTTQELTFNDGLPIVMTHKDAVKCQHFTSLPIYYTDVKVEYDGSGEEMLNQYIDTIL